VGLLDVWACHAKSPHLAGPFLRTACLLASRTDLLAVSVVPPPPQPTTTTDDKTGSGSGDTSSVPAPVPIPQLLVSLARAETCGCGDVARLTDAGSLLCALVPHENPCHASAVQGLLVLLISRYPLVRRWLGTCACCLVPRACMPPRHHTAAHPATATALPLSLLFSPTACACASTHSHRRESPPHKSLLPSPPTPPPLCAGAPPRRRAAVRHPAVDGFRATAGHAI
jgi:hypothetical protein